MNQPVIVYCIDASALIELAQTYPRSNIPGIWDELALLVREGRLIAPREVEKEVHKDYELAPWVKQHRAMFVKLTAKQIELVNEIERDSPGLIDEEKETPDADPFVIALAIARNREPSTPLFPQTHIVLTCEKPTKGQKPKIPDVCAKWGVPCISGGGRALTELIKREGWTLSSSRTNSNL
ncbi:MAG: DUF4411 family protein [Phycisphaerae bacterium]|nr:DUF4411 family protein [Phycisphaerae bacterium]